MKYLTTLILLTKSLSVSLWMYCDYSYLFIKKSYVYSSIVVRPMHHDKYIIYTTL